jgi:hypothetical protein
MSMRNAIECVVDLPPEYCQYPDHGCEVEQSCLNCRLPVCIYEEHGGKQKLLKQNRALEMERLHDGENKSVGEIAAVFAVSKRTVQRALRHIHGNNVRRSN